MVPLDFVYVTLVRVYLLLGGLLADLFVTRGFWLAVSLVILVSFIVTLSRNNRA